MPNSSSSTITLNVNIIFVQRDDGSGNFQENNTEHQEIINEELTFSSRKTVLNYANLIDNQTTTSYNVNGAACAHFPSSTNFTRSSRIHMPDRFSKYWWMKNIAPSIYNQP